jgi:hypothetical protein
MIGIDFDTLPENELLKISTQISSELEENSKGENSANNHVNTNVPILTVYLFDLTFSKNHVFVYLSDLTLSSVHVYVHLFDLTFSQDHVCVHLSDLTFSQNHVRVHLLNLNFSPVHVYVYLRDLRWSAQYRIRSV